MHVLYVVALYVESISKNPLLMTCVVFDSHDACMTMHVNACVCCVNQVRDLLFLFLSEEDPNTLPLVPVAARVVLGV